MNNLTSTLRDAAQYGLDRLTGTTHGTNPHRSSSSSSNNGGNHHKQQRHGNNRTMNTAGGWRWDNMYSVAEEDEFDDDDAALLADFGLHQLEDGRSGGVGGVGGVGGGGGGGRMRGYHAPLIRNDHHPPEPLPHEDFSNSSKMEHRNGNLIGGSMNGSFNFFDPSNHDPNNPNNNNNDNIGFILLKKLRLLPKNEGWAAVSDLDLFFTSIYHYYYHRGLGSIIGKGVVELLSLIFTLWLSLVLFAYIDWRELRKCNDEETCHERFFEGYVRQRPFSYGSGHGHGGGGADDGESALGSYSFFTFLQNAWIVIYILLFTMYGLFSSVQFLSQVLTSIESKLFLQEVLGIRDRDLMVGTIEWGQLVEKMSEAQRSGRCRVAILPRGPGVSGSVNGMRSGGSERGESLTSNFTGGGQHSNVEEDEGPTGHLVVAQRIMRRENFLIAFFNRNMLDLTLPTLPPWLWPFTLWTNKPREEKMVFYSKSIEWSIYLCVLNYMFNHSRKIRPAFYGDPSSLRKRFVLCGVAHAIFMPFLLFFMTLHFFMLNIYDWQSTKTYLGPREWSSVARWTFREFNELPHSFERRLEPSYKSAASYLEMFGKPSPFSVALGRLLVFVSGSLGTLLLAFAAMNDAILLHVKIGPWNLLWYAGVLGACFSVGKGMLPPSANPHFGHARRNLVEDMDAALEKVATHTHYLPDAWRGKGWDDRTKKSFSVMFQYKAHHFAMELLSIIVAPIILCVSLPRCATDLCKFVRDSKVEVPGVGDVVGYSTFDFDSFEDENWMGKGDIIVARGGAAKSSFVDENGRESILGGGRPKTRHGKMEKSFFNFKSVYPNWKCLPCGQNLVNLVESFRHQQEMALARERRLHIDAAAAQLETLRRLEMEREKKAALGLSRFVDSRHIRSASSGPDSGGGGALKSLNSHSNYHSQNSGDALSDFGSFGTLPNDVLHHPQVHFEESTNSFIPPSQAFAHSSLIHGAESGDDESPRDASPSLMRHGSVMHYADAGLSMELRGLLNRSSLVDPYDAEQSFTGSLIPVDEASISILDIRADQQYMWLDRYHSEMPFDRQKHGQNVNNANNDEINGIRNSQNDEQNLNCALHLT